MANVPLDQGLLLAAILFALGLAGVLVRRNLLFMLMSLEVMLSRRSMCFTISARSLRWPGTPKLLHTRPSRPASHRWGFASRTRPKYQFRPSVSRL